MQYLYEKEISTYRQRCGLRHLYEDLPRRKGEQIMDDKKIARINELSATAKERELTEEEHAERAQLRAEYVAAYKQSLVNHLNNVKIVDDKGNKTPLRKKTEKKNEKH